MSYNSQNIKNHAGLIFALTLILSTSALFASNVPLSWSPPTTNADGTPLSDLAGYKVHVGSSPGSYNQNIDAGNATTYTVSNLTEGLTYYFTVSAYDIYGNESAYSNEAAKLVQLSLITYYCDKDNDGYIDASISGTCSGTGCAPSGCMTTAGSDCNDNNPAINPGAADYTCNGIDENCSGQADEGYIAASTTCGVGNCVSAGQNICQAGNIVNTCTPAPPQTEGPAGGPTCTDLKDNDCNGLTDASDSACQVVTIDLVSGMLAPTSAVAGSNITISIRTKNNGAASASASTTRFYLSANNTYDAGDIEIGSRPVPTLAAGASDYVSVALAVPSSSRLGANYIISRADADNVVIETDETNNNNSKAITINPFCTDNDNDGFAIEGGACGAVDCNDNNPAINPGASDSACNGIDDNCNGQTDEGYVDASTSCGMGVCAAVGQNLCQNGTIINTCTPGQPSGTDADCNGIDENCDGTVDNNYVSATTTCGVGACASTGIQQCNNGLQVDTCTPYSPAVEVCDGLDNNCDGQTDEGCSPVIKVDKVLLSEDFADGMPSAWTAGGKWTTDNPCGQTIDVPFAPPFAIVDSSCTATGSDELVTPSFDAGSCSNAQLSFSNQYKQNTGNVEVNISDDDGTNWTNNLLMVSNDGYPVPVWKDVDISSVAGSQNAKIKFKYSDNGYWALDNMLVTCQPTQLAFSSPIQLQSPAQTIMITNTGNESLSISTIGFQGADPADFTVDNAKDTCSNKTLLPSESCTLDVIFMPVTAGAKSADLAINSSDPVTPVLTVHLSGAAIVINPKPAIKANGLTGTVNVKKGTNVTITFDLDPESYQNINGDWWVLLVNGSNKYYYKASTGKWSRGSSLYYKGPLVTKEAVKVYSNSKMPAGSYKFYFGVDTKMNGVRDSKQYYSDLVTVNVK